MTHREQVRLLIEMLAICLVDDTDAVSVSLVETPNATIIVVQVSPDEVGKIIGKNGIMARSIRNMLSAISSKTQHRYQLEIKP
jgi:predicted RNA-binding protein YlqC (UPF0109 family)